VFFFVSEVLNWYVQFNASYYLTCLTCVMYTGSLLKCVRGIAITNRTACLSA